MSLARTVADLNWWWLSSLGRRAVEWGDTGATVTFTFDDFPRTAYTAGGAILKAHGARGTYYTAIGLMDSVNELGPHFSRKDLADVVDDGHELANHTFSHLSSRRTSTAAYIADASRGSAALQEFRTASHPTNFSYPFGHVTRGVKSGVGATMQSCRTTRAGLNGPTIDLNLLRANRLYSWCFDLDAANRLIVENEKNGGWLIFYTHDIQDSPSPFGCTPEHFESVVDLAARSRSRITTIAAALASMQQPPSA